MSISPSLNPGSTSSSSSSHSPSQTSNPNHGFLISSNQPLRISDVPPPPPPHLSGQVAPAAQDPTGSSKQVNGKERRSRGRSPIHQNGGKTSHPDFVSSQRSAASSSQISSSGHSSGRKAQINGNHLLNFHYDSISVSRPQPRAPPPRRYQKRKPYNKDLFFQANYKFVLLDSGNYTAESMDPDKMFCWDDIICFKYSTPFPVYCPICLDDPLCQQITSCGHIFCFPCILQYFYMSGEADLKDVCWKKCPLCFAMISSKDLYTICIENVKQYCVGDEIEFVLLTRPKGSFSSLFKNNESINLEEEILDSFSKFTLTSDVELSVREAMSDLDSWVARANSGLVDDIEKLPYVCAAIEQLKRRKKYWNEHRTSNGNKETAENGNLDWYEKSSSGKVVEEFNKSLEDPERSSFSSIDDSKNLRTVSVGIEEGKYGDSYNFYQATDGQHLILHSLSMKCLLHHYGNYDNLPNRISGKILQLESVTQSEAMRRRYRFLSHFSLTTTFQFCEINLRTKLPVESLSPFMDEIKNREKQRKQLARKELKEQIKAEVAGSQFVAMSYYSHGGPSPSFSVDDFEALGSSPAAASSSWPTPTNGERQQSFSSVARLGFAAAQDSLSLNTPLPDQVPLKIDNDTSSSATGWRNSNGTSFADITSRAKQVEMQQSKPKLNEAGKKSKKQPSRVLMSTAGGRRY